MLNKQKGAFTIELALILAFVAGFFALQVNYVVATAKKGQMDRLAYSLASVLSERRELFRDEGNICRRSGECNQLIEDMHSIAESAMTRMSNVFVPSRFGIRIEELVVHTAHARYVVKEKGYVGCNFVPLSKLPDIVPITTRNRKLPVYKVSLCYQTPFNILGVARGEFVDMVSSSFSFARI
ncbi:tight adherence pilus pseudopilin TadF [Vibrio nigripulchritudo]|uniref:Flp pilus assembly protein TadF n=1 Tax=Vibrio nigripulchritudo SOn1 TaxID=1238450 RepID=A0AAV2VTS3_9VIBR|nr:tight adherence pilus pseudopilin TadF [Vibrio nigripulchritudo]CCN71200.1 conserved exported hypothetical protein [Vibrio nigripulchritudo SFn118]CCO48022.1 conserved exported hypothetical protein [Vibrio nigripulchritudo SOn1]